MTEEVKAEEVVAHETETAMLQTAPAEVDAGSDMALKVKVSCSSACDLRGGIVEIMAQDAVVKQTELVSFDGAVNETDELVVQAPVEPGEYTWTAVYSAQEKEGVLHEESSAPFSFVVKPHVTSLLVWDAPSPVALNSKFKLKAGVKCSAGCRLTGEKVEVYDQEGCRVVMSTLGDVPWRDTAALYWTEIELEAPSEEGFYRWEARFPKPDLELPHEEAAHTFAFRTTKPLDHVLTVEVIDTDKKTPVKNALVSLYSHGGTPYRGRSDETGVARVNVPKGEYRLTVVMSDYDDFETQVEVAEDATVKVELTYWPED
jgi:hypothetical protein